MNIPNKKVYLTAKRLTPKNPYLLVCPLCEEVFNSYVTHTHLVYIGMQDVLLMINEVNENAQLEQKGTVI
jgi:hypothetical protein